MSPTNPLIEAAGRFQRTCHERSWRFCFIGGLAVLRWGEPRLTRDVDATLITGYGHEADFAEALLAEFESRIPDPEQFASQNRVLLARAPNGVPLDIAFGALPFEERTVRRASPFTISGEELMVCSAEDLIVHKVFAGREQDWVDVEGVLARQGSDLDHDLVEEELGPLLEATGAPERLERLRRMRGPD